MSNLDELFARLWDDYAAINAQVAPIHALLEQRGERVVNDHIALRTFDRAPIGLDALARPFVDGGYAPRGTYQFPDKHLRARHYEHPEADRPKLFISELVVDDLPARACRIVDALVAQVPDTLPARDAFPIAGRPWRVTLSDYDHLLENSEYAAWLAAFGFRANHFTVSVNALRSFDGLAPLNDFLLEHGFELNDSGGRIKGSPAALLEQSATLASRIQVELADGSREIPGCYYEFARRYRRADGTMFSGFIAQSADRLFESTDAR